MGQLVSQNVPQAVRVRHACRQRDQRMDHPQQQRRADRQAFHQLDPALRVQLPQNRLRLRGSRRGGPPDALIYPQVPQRKPPDAGQCAKPPHKSPESRVPQGM